MNRRLPSYYITTAELDLKAFIGNMIALFREEAIGAYTFMCKVTDGKGTVESNEATLTITDIPASGLAENIIGKWMVEELNGQPCPTNWKTVLTFVSPTKAYGSLSDFSTPMWNVKVLADVKIDGNKVNVINTDGNIRQVLDCTILSITDKDLLMSSDWNVYEDGEIAKITHDGRNPDGVRTTEWLQSKDYVNLLNATVERWNAENDEAKQLNIHP